MAGYKILLLDDKPCVVSCVRAHCWADEDAIALAHALVGPDAQVDFWTPGDCPDIFLGLLDGQGAPLTAAVVRKAASVLDAPPDRSTLQWLCEPV